MHVTSTENQLMKTPPIKTETSSIRMATSGQGAQSSPHNRFQQHQQITDSAYINYLVAEGEAEAVKTKSLEVFPKTIVNAVKSPDVPLPWSLNPYQGCEHGCAYCYARNSHEYWGYSAGVDFERVLLVKRNAHQLLEATLKQPSWKGEAIMLSGNTDCYQPIERKFELTRKLLEVFVRYQHPVGIITKNALIQRDLDLLSNLAKKNLVTVTISITTLNETLRRNMEPRTASIKKRLETIEVLASAGIPVNVMMAPIIPGLNSHEIFQVLRAAKNAGATNAAYTMVRLNGHLANIFSDWLEATYPDRTSRVLNNIRNTHAGTLHDNQFGRRMKGSGAIAQQIKESFRIAKQKCFGMPDNVVLNSQLFLQLKQPQLKLF
jgi:DNA repair photolyase